MVTCTQVHEKHKHPRLAEQTDGRDPLISVHKVLLHQYSGAFTPNKPRAAPNRSRRRRKHPAPPYQPCIVCVCSGRRGKRGVPRRHGGASEAPGRGGAATDPARAPPPGGPELRTARLVLQEEEVTSLLLLRILWADAVDIILYKLYYYYILYPHSLKILAKAVGR